MKETFEIDSAYNRIKGIVKYPLEEGGPFACVIFSHGLLSSKESSKYVEISEGLATLGIMSVSFDYHGCGESGGKIEETTLTKRLENLERVFEFAYSNRRVDRERIGILGSSFGGTIAILKAAKDKRVKALVIFATPYRLEKNKDVLSGLGFPDSFFRDFSSYNVLSAASSVSNCLVIHGENDEVVPSEHAMAIFESLKEPKRLEIIEGADHTFSNPYHRKVAIGIALSWLKDHLL